MKVLFYGYPLGFLALICIKLTCEQCFHFRNFTLVYVNFIDALDHTLCAQCTK